MQDAAAPFMQTQTKGVRFDCVGSLRMNEWMLDLHTKWHWLMFIFQICGSAQFFFSKDQLQALPSDGRLHVTACVTDSFTGEICLEA